MTWFPVRSQGNSYEMHSPLPSKDIVFPFFPLDLLGVSNYLNVVERPPASLLLPNLIFHKHFFTLVNTS